MELMFQILTTLGLMLGIFLGEIISYKSFGKPKDYAFLIDIILFVVVLVGIFNFIEYYTYDIFWYATNFTIGFLTILTVRTLEYFFGMTEGNREYVKLSTGVIRILYKYGMTKEEIINVFKEAGLKTDENLLELLKRERPPFIPKLLRLERDIKYIRRKVSCL